MICCFRKNDRTFTLNSLVDTELFDGETLREPTRWIGFLESEKGQFQKWLTLPGAQLAEIKADMVGASCHDDDSAIWAHLPPETSLGAVILAPKIDSDMRIYRPVKILTRPAPELKTFLKCDRYPLVGRLSGNLVFKRANRDLILRN